MNETLSLRLSHNAKFARWIGFSIIAVLIFGTTAAAQNFKLDEYLKKKDVNRNGRVDPEELSDNARGFLKKMGFDASKSISISRIVSKASKDRKAAAAKDSKVSRTRKVPGFGVEKATESTGVSRFGASGSTTAAKKVEYSESVTRQVSDTLRRYDRNKDGSLDKRELRDARWGSPPPEQSDTNKDGRLTRDELANRYASREQSYRRSSSSSSSRSDRDRDRELAKKKETEDRARRDRDRSRSRSSSSSSNSNSSRSSSNSRSPRSSYRSTSTSSKPASSTSRSSRTSSSSSSSSMEKYEKYAESLVSQYDQDKDGKLSKEETKKMRRPPAGADADKDGFITKSELVGSLSGSTKPTAVAKPEKSSDKNTKSAASTRSGRDRVSSRSKSSRPGSSSAFEKLDVNADKSVQMHEYSKKWDDELVQEFYEKDKNGDGVITLREWTGKN